MERRVALYSIIFCTHRTQYKRVNGTLPVYVQIHKPFPNLNLQLTNKEASTVLCSVVKHLGSGRALKKC